MEAQNSSKNHVAFSPQKCFAYAAVLIVLMTLAFQILWVQPLNTEIARYGIAGGTQERVVVQAEQVPGSFESPLLLRRNTEPDLSEIAKAYREMNEQVRKFKSEENCL